eukprot:gene13627-biopygen5715
MALHQCTRALYRSHLKANELQRCSTVPGKRSAVPSDQKSLYGCLTGHHRNQMRLKMKKLHMHVPENDSWRMGAGFGGEYEKDPNPPEAQLRFVRQFPDTGEICVISWSVKEQRWKFVGPGWSCFNSFQPGEEPVTGAGEYAEEVEKTDLVSKAHAMINAKRKAQRIKDGQDDPDAADNIDNDYADMFQTLLIPEEWPNGITVRAEANEDPKDMIEVVVLGVPPEQGCQVLQGRWRTAGGLGGLGGLAWRTWRTGGLGGLAWRTWWTGGLGGLADGLRLADLADLADWDWRTWRTPQANLADLADWI